MKQVQHTFDWVGLNHSGKLVQGKLIARNKTLAKVILHKEGITVHRICANYRVFRKRLTGAHCAHFTKQLAALLEANIPLTQALELLSSQTTHQATKHLIDSLKYDLKCGLSLALALKKHPKNFSESFCHIIRAGELSGTLSHLLQSLAKQETTQHQIKRKIQASLAYPAAIISIALMVTLGLLHFVVPQFEALFASFHTKLPKATLYLIGATHFIQKNGLTVLAVLTAAVMVYKKLRQSMPLARVWQDRMYLKLPLVGSIVLSLNVAKLMHLLSTLLQAGYPLVESFSMALEGVQNKYIQKSLSHVQTGLNKGQPLHYTLEMTQQFPKALTELIHVGETAGALEEMILHIAAQQSERFYIQLAAFSSLFEPLLMAVLGVWIAILIFALYLPIFQLGLVIS